MDYQLSMNKEFLNEVQLREAKKFNQLQKPVEEHIIDKLSIPHVIFDARVFFTGTEQFKYIRVQIIPLVL